MGGVQTAGCIDNNIHGTHPHRLQTLCEKSHVSGVTEVNGALNEIGVHLALYRKYKKREQGFYWSFSGKLLVANNQIAIK